MKRLLAVVAVVAIAISVFVVHAQDHALMPEGVTGPDFIEVTVIGLPMCCNRLVFSVDNILAIQVAGDGTPHLVFDQGTSYHLDADLADVLAVLDVAVIPEPD